MTKISVTALTDQARLKLPLVFNAICPHSWNGKKITVVVEKHGMHSEEDRVWQIGFLLSRFVEGYLKENRDFTFLVERQTINT